jgi:adenylate cyclase
VQKDASWDPGVRVARIRLAGLAGALITAAILAVFAGSLFAEPLFDRYQRWQPRQIAQTRVHIVRIDAESLRALGPWPWPRSYLAILTDRIREAGAVAIGYNFIFAEPDPTSSPERIANTFSTLSPSALAEINSMPSLDARFGKAIGEAPVVVGRIGLQPNSVDAQGLTGASAASLYVEMQFTAPLPKSVVAFPLAEGNVDDIEDSALGQALLNSSPDSDGVVRRVPIAANVAGVPTPGLPLELVRVAERRDSVTPEIARGELRGLHLGDHYVPTNGAGEARLHFGQDLPEGSETSAVNMMRKPMERGALAGKIVIIDGAAAGLGSVVFTPLGNSDYGARVFAQAVDAILQGGWLVRPAWAPLAEWLLGGVLAMLAIWQQPRIGSARMLIAFITPLLVLFVVSWSAFSSKGLLLDPLRPVMLASGAILSMAAVMFYETLRRSAQVRLFTAGRQGEMNAARKIQMSLLPDPQALAELSVGLDLDAFVEPAGMIGGDLYDAFSLPAGRVVFLIGDVSGHGPSAALFMAVANGMVHSALRRSDAPLNEVIASLNDEMIGDRQNLLEVTMVCAILDTDSGDVELVNAGHEYPFVLRLDGMIEELQMDGGLPLCTMPGSTYPLQRVRLAPGEAIVLVTDGVREAQSPKGDYFGTERTVQSLASWTKDEPASVAISKLVAAVRAFEAGNPPRDDLTVLALRYRP